MKKIIFYLMCLLPMLGIGQTTLSPGDIIVVSINGDVDTPNSYGRGFSFMPLVNLEAGTVINFTDYGWSDVTGAFINNTSIADAFIHYTAPTSITAGTIIRCDSYSHNNFTYDYSYSGGGNPYLNTAGLTQSDELLIFQGTIASPTFIFAVTFVSTTINPAGWSTSVGTNGTDGSGAGSALPPGLTNDITAFSFNQPETANDNSTYTGPTTAATAADWRIRIQNYANWTFNDAIPIPTPPVGPYTILGTSAAPTVTTQAVSSIASTTATGNGNVTSLGSPNPTAHGVCWNTTGTPTISDSKVDNGGKSSTGAFTASMTGLSANTTYYVRAYATNTAGTVYGTEVSFTTLPQAPTVTTQAVSSIGTTTATGNGNITSLGGPNPTAHGVCWNTTGTPSILDSKVDNGAKSSTGAFTGSMTSLSANTTYYVRAYATNTAGTSYGSEVSFTTSPIAPTVTTQAVSSITATTATGNGNVTSLGVPNPTAHGVCWNTTGTPTVSDSKVDNGAKSATGAFTASMTSLSANTTYYVRAYATNTGGTSYGTEVSFTTSPIAPTVTTQAVSSIGTTTATGNGNVTSLGAPNPTAHGVCWNTTGTPTVSDNKVDNGAKSATGAFTASMNSLSANTTYYVRAYATNTAGTSYGTEVSFTTSGISPTVTTQAVSSIATTTATGNGNVTSLGVPNPTAHGVCWNTTGTPTTSDSKVDNGAKSATGAFTASMSSLSANTTYYVRAYATNTAGTSYGTEVSFTTSPIAPTVTTQAVSSITATTATGNGNVTSLGVPNPTAHGVCWNTTGTPTVSDSKVDNGAKSTTGAFTASITSLSANTTYYVRAYATNTAGTSYGTEVSFTTSPIAPTVTTQAVSSITATTATGNGNVTSLGVPNPTAHGVCWNTTGTPSTSDSKVDNGAKSATGAFTASMTSLSANTTYYVRAYATNIAGTSYGTEVSFTTSPIAPTVTTQAVSSITATTATGNGNVTSLGVPNPTAHGVCWNTTGTPTTSGSKVDNGAKSTTGAFTASMTSLSANTTYYVRAYATNTGGTSYGTEVSFTTSPIAPTVTTQAVSSITATTATGNGNVTSLGVPNPTAHGVCWNTTGTPTVSDSKVDNGAKSTTGAFTASITSLSANTTYYVRAFATNTGGTSYGTEVSFTTSPIAPTVTTQAVSSITATTATGNGNVTSLGVPNPTAHGVCWNTTGTPTVSGSKVDNGAKSATGAFTASMTSLSANTTYYVRAYATNTGGTSYGTEVSFTTSPIAPTVTTQAVSAITATTATGNGNVTSLGVPNPTAHGVCWNTTGTPTVSDSKVDNGAKSATGAFTASMTSLSANTTYYVRAYATNTGGTSYGTEVSFTTLTINHAPTDISISGSSVNENVLANSTVGTFSTTDPDAGNTFTYSLVAGVGSTDNASFNISGNSLFITNSPDFETKNSYSIRILTSDQGSLTFEKVFTITINDVNEPPVVNAAQTFTINENLANSSNVGTIVATDQDAGTIFSGWAITGGNTSNAFAINPSTGVITVNNSTVLDRELASSFSLTVTVSDGINTSTAQTVTINITDLNDVVPAITAAQAFTINENLANSSNVGTVIATDGDVTATNYSNWAITGGNTNNAFAIGASTGIITVNNSAELDRELVSSFNLTVTVSDGANTSAAQTVVINLTDLNDEVPEITSAQVLHVTEQSPNGTTVGTVLATDEDITATTFQNWTITAGNSSGYFTINPSTGVITIVDNTGLNPAINPTFTLTLTVSDGVNTSLSQTVTIIVDAINDENPVITTSQSFSINENSANSTVVGQVLATDPDYGTVFQGWSITSGNTGNAFAINSSTGEITVNTSSMLDYESTPSFTLTIQVSDGLHNASGVVAITLNNVNETPSDITLSASTIDENVIANSTVGTLGSTDPDAANTFTYTLIAGVGSTDNVSFSISGNSLSINNSPDFETKSSYSVRVRTEDQGSLNFEKVFTITINNVNESPTDMALSANSIDENVLANSAVGTLSSMDPDAADTFTYTLVAGVGSTDNASFNISGNSFLITNSPDFETKNSYSVRVRAEDQGSLSYEKVLTITINDLNEFPTDMILSASSIDENATANSAVGTLTTTDPDAANTFTYTLVAGAGDTDNASFSISGNSLLMVNSPDFETQGSYSVRVRTEDQGGLSFEKVITVAVNNLNDNAPEIQGGSFSIDENSANGTSVGTISASDADGTLNGLTFSIVSGNTNNAFALNPSTGEITVNATGALDFETNPSFNIVVHVSDGTNSDDTVVTIHLNDVVESGIESNILENLTLYPNPASERVSIDLRNKSLNGLKVEIIDVNGAKVFQSEANGSSDILTIPLNGIATGVYILRIYNDHLSCNHKLIIQK